MCPFFKQKCQTFAGFGFLNARICSFVFRIWAVGWTKEAVWSRHFGFREIVVEHDIYWTNSLLVWYWKCLSTLVKFKLVNAPNNTKPKCFYWLNKRSIYPLPYSSWLLVADTPKPQIHDIKIQMICYLIGIDHQMGEMIVITEQKYLSCILIFVWHKI